MRLDIASRQQFAQELFAPTDERRLPLGNHQVLSYGMESPNDIVRECLRLGMTQAAISDHSRLSRPYIWRLSNDLRGVKATQSAIAKLRATLRYARRRSGRAA
jgi:hypothetical protein